MVIFSLGTDLRSDEMPKEKLSEFIEAFRKIKQRVVWKYDGEAPKNLPENVKLFKWFPLSSALAHPKVVLFITHGGILSVEESLFRGVPMLFIPFVGDQQRTARQAQRHGYGVTLQFDDVNQENLENAINFMTANAEFKQKANEVSNIFTANPVAPMKEAMFWIEHSVKTKGARYLKSSVDLQPCQHLLLDVAAFFVTIFVIFFVFLLLIIKFAVKRYRNKEQRGKFKYY